MRAPGLLQPHTFRQNMFQHRVVIEHVQGPGTRTHAPPDVGDKPSQSGLWKRIEEINNEWSVRKLKRRSIRADRFEREASLRFALIAADVLARDGIERSE